MSETEVSNNPEGLRRALTGSLPLVFVHLALAIVVDNLHVLEHRTVLGMLIVLGKNFVEFLFVYQVEVVLRGKSEDTRDQLTQSNVRSRRLT